jgi:hypothetical protein
MFANRDTEGFVLEAVVVGIVKAKGSSLSSFASRVIDCRLDDRVVARKLSMTVGVDLRFEVRFGKWAEVLSLHATADFRFDDLVEVVTVDDVAGGTHLETAFPSSAGSGSTVLAVNAVDGRLADLGTLAFSFLACLETPSVGVLLREVVSNRRSALDGPLSSLFILKPVLLADG